MIPRLATGVLLLGLCTGGGRAEPAFTPDWESLATHQTPQWLVDGKFGIFIHWMPNSVPAFNDEWYARWMYKEDHEVYRHHRDTWGDQKTFGYKDFIPLFKAEHWDPVAWVELFEEAGARFVVPNAEHHDHFAMWDSALTGWDAKDMGPQRDVIGELGAAARAVGLRYGVSNHRARGWNFYTYKPAFDTMDPAGAEFYWPQLGKEPDAEWLADWQARLHELVDQYHPDLMWFDYGWANPAFEPYKKDYAAYYYNRAADRNQAVTLVYKGDNLPKGVGVLDVERGKLDRLWPEVWMTDTTVFKNTWGFVTGAPLKPVDEIIDDLVDIVSKNGTLLLNIGPGPDGTISAEQQDMLRAIGRWLATNGNAIYDSRPFDVDGEEAGGIRYTRRENKLYTLFLDKPAGSVSLSSLTPASLGGLTVRSVTWLDGGAHAEWTQGDQGLTLQIPDELPGDHVWVAEIELQGIGFGQPVVRVEHRPAGGAVFAHGRIYNFTDQPQSLDVRLFINGRGGRQLCRVGLAPGEWGDVRYQHRDQNHYGATHLLLDDLAQGIYRFQLGGATPRSSERVVAFPSIPLVGTWRFHAGDDPAWSAPDLDASEWVSTQVPGPWPLGREPDQVGWFRRSVQVPAGWLGQDLSLNLGVIGDADRTFFNGEEIGHKGVKEVEFHFSHEIRKFVIPAALVQVGKKNVIAVRVYNQDHDGGLLGPPGSLSLAR